jgi:hypothetical protein
MKLQEEEEIAIRFNERVAQDLQRKIKSLEAELELLREEYSYREKACSPYFRTQLANGQASTPKASAVASTHTPAAAKSAEPSKPSSKRGPMSKGNEADREAVVLEVIKSNGGINVSVQTIAKALGITREATRAWMNRLMSKKHAPWKYGKDKSKYSLS